MVALAALLACVGLRLSARQPLAWIALALALAAGLMLIGSSVPPGPTSVSGPTTAVVMGWVVVAVLGVGWCWGRLRAAVGTVAVWLLLVGVGVVAWLATTSSVEAAAVVTLAALIVLGLLPRLALTVAGSFALDTAVSQGAEVTKRSALDRITEAHGSLAGGVLIASVVLGGQDPDHRSARRRLRSLRRRWCDRLGQQRHPRHAGLANGQRRA